jgi:hypothetical protein
MRMWIRVVAVIVAVALGASVFYAWRSARREQAGLQSQLKAAQQAVAEAEARQQSRETELNALLGRLEKQKAVVQSPAQVLKALPEVLPLPQPLTMEPLDLAPTNRTSTSSPPDAPNAKVNLPAEDLKPLFDFAVNCRKCQARLTTAQADLKDEQVKTQSMSRERDDALRVARGGSMLRRVARAAKWFAIGAAAGAVAVKLKH